MSTHAHSENDRPVALPDAELVAAARRGDKRAFVEIVARHQAMVCGIALGVLGDFAASEDAAQEAFLTAWRKFHELRDPARLRAWLAQIARNSALGHLRRWRGHESLDDIANVADESPGPDESAATREEAELVRASLAALPENYRLPLILYYREHQSVRAVAEALEISEDAVKQRLARGREMLRDQMAGTIERVLTRGGPGAVFTMSIATAIDALATPAAVAAGVFSAGSAVAGTGVTAAASASTTVNATPLLTAMSTSKTILITAAVVGAACIPVGYQISADRGWIAGTNLPELSEIRQAAAAEAKMRSFEHSQLFIEWQTLHDVHGRTADAMPALYQAISDLHDPFRRRAFHAALIAEWAQLNPAAGMKFFFARGRDSSHRQQFFDEWLAMDPEAAISALLEGGTGWETVARNSLSDIARRAPSKLAQIVERLPKSNSYWDSTVRDAFAIVAERDVNVALRSALDISGPNKNQALEGAVQVWAKHDLQAAIEWAKSLTDALDRNEIIRAALIGKAAVDPVPALELAGIVPIGGRDGYFATTTGARILKVAAEVDFEATAAWLAAHPGRFGQEDMMGMANATTLRLNTDPVGFLESCMQNGTLSAVLPAIESALLNEAGGQRAAVWEWLKSQSDDSTFKRFRERVLNSAAYRTPELALQWAAEFPETPEGETQIRTLTINLLNSGTALNRLDSLLEECPERMRLPLMESAFSQLQERTLDNPYQWIERLKLLPEAMRSQSAESLARAWSERSPEEAISWVSSLPADEARARIVGAIARAWAGEDAHGAAHWISQMPPGAERDRGAESLAAGIGDQYPHAAWEWALSIGDSDVRSRTAAELVPRMITRDPATAREWIETRPFPTALRTRMQEAVANPASTTAH